MKSDLKTATSFALLLSVLIIVANGATPNCMGTVEQSYAFPLVTYDKVNPFLKDDPDYQALAAKLVGGACNPDRDAGEVCAVTPSFGSGLSMLANEMLIGLSDRGPNQDCEDLCELDPVKYSDACGKKGKGFPVPKFAPAFAKFSVKDDGIVVDEFVYFKGMSGAPLSGISTTSFDDTPYGPDCRGEPLPLDKNGIDPEDIHEIPGSNGLMAFVEEYSPSILLCKADGTVFARYAPQSVAPLLDGADMKVYGTLPDIFKERRKNRGFENLVITKDGSTLIAILQSPMGDNKAEGYSTNRIIRSAVFKIALMDDESEPAKLTYEKQFAILGSPNESYAADVDEADLKYSAAEYIDDDTFLALERSKGQVKYFAVDWTAASNLDDVGYGDNLDLELITGSQTTPEKQLPEGFAYAKKTKVADTASNVPGGMDNFEGSAKQEGVVITDDGMSILTADDNDFGLENNGALVLYKINLGRNVTGTTVCGRPEVPPPPKKLGEGKGTFTLVDQIVLSDKPDVAKAEIVAVDRTPGSNIVYTANADTGSVDGYMRTPLSDTPVVSYKGENAKCNSVSVCKKNGYVAAALEDNETSLGTLVIIEFGDDEIVRTSEYKNSACFVPDAVKWSDDCAYVVLACEGEGAENPGGVGVWTKSSHSDFEGTYTVATFDKFDTEEMKKRLDDEGVRYFQAEKPSLAMEPEFPSFTSDGQYAYITLQENNALAVVDVAEAVISEIKPLIYTPRSVEGYGIDASDKDDMINIRTYPRVFGMCQPDAIVTYPVAGKDYFVVACEGDAWDDVEEIRAADIENDLNRNIPEELKSLVADEALLGRLEVSYPMGYNAETNTQEALYHFGARSFQIYAMDGTCVLESGDWMEQIHAEEYPKIFNSQSSEGDETQEDEFDSRSDAKGIETESVYVAEIEGKMVLFVGNERTSTIMAFDISDPTAPIYLASTLNTPVNISSNEIYATGTQGIIDPESLEYFDGLLYVAAPFASTVSTLKFEMEESDFTPCIHTAETCHCGKTTFGNCLKPSGDGKTCNTSVCSGLTCLCPIVDSGLIQVPKTSKLCTFKQISYFAATDSAINGNIPCVKVLGTGLV